MLKTILVNAIALGIFFISLTVSAQENGEGKIYEGMKITPEMSKKIIDEITAKYSKMYEKYAGVKSTRHVTVKWYHPKTMELLETEKVVYTRWDDFYEDLKYEVLEYTVNGKPKDPKSYDPRESKPGIPHFDKNGDKEYIREVVGVETVRGKLAYKVKATPRVPKDEHFKGFIWLTVDNYELIQNEGTSGKSRFAVDALYVKYLASDFGDYFHFTHGYTKVTLNVLGMYKRILVFDFENKDIEPMPLPRKK
ncbi:MAG TPA: hypothetical protein PKG52_02120 [bacterium]|nr:hypothetical protein [bacterium]HPS28667.1 hypothetical protein [bacterium]